MNVGWNQPFYSYNDNSSTGNNVTNANIRYMTGSQFYYRTPNSELKTDKSFGTYEKISDDPLTVKYTVSKDAKWSDGTPYDASDLLLGWADASGNVNTVTGDKVKRDKATGAAKPSGNQVYFDSAAATPGQSLALVKETPKLSDDNKSLTLVYTKPFADWQFDMGPVGPDLPAHVIGKKALGISDPTKAKAAVVKAIQDKDDASLSKIANFWNTGFDYTSLPSDKAPVRSPSVPTSSRDIKKDSYVTLKKNPYYKGEREANVDTMTVRFNPDANSQLQQLGNKEISLMDPQVTTDLVAGGREAQQRRDPQGRREHLRAHGPRAEQQRPVRPGQLRRQRRQGARRSPGVPARRAAQRDRRQADQADRPRRHRPQLLHPRSRRPRLRRGDGRQRFRRLRQDRPGKVAVAAEGRPASRPRSTSG